MEISRLWAYTAPLHLKPHFSALSPAQYDCSMESPQEFSARAARLLAEAKVLSSTFGDQYGELNRWMAQAKLLRMTWVDGLAFAVDRMQHREACSDGRPV